MRLKIDNTTHDFLPIRDFRAMYDLPPEFGVAYFEPKDFTGLGSIDRAGAAMNHVRVTVLNALPRQITAAGWQVFMPTLTTVFRTQMHTINDQVNLREVEIDFAVAGFSDVVQAYAYALLRAQAERGEPPPSQAVYADWLYSTVRVSTTPHEYRHHGYAWTVHIIHHAYGRIGLRVQTHDSAYYVQDGALGCPAEGFMTVLLTDVMARMRAATN